MVLLNISFTLKYNFNFISFDQLKETGILSHNYPESIILKKTGNIISLA